MPRSLENDREAWSPRSMIRVEFEKPDDFLKIKEALTRMGVATRGDKRVYQSCHILHKQGQYFIAHFKELLLLDGSKSVLEASDIARRNRIAQLLEDWNMVKIMNPEVIDELIPMRELKVISRRDLEDGWELVPKYIFSSERKK